VGFCYRPGQTLLVHFNDEGVMDWETELIDSFETIVHRDFPNAQRIGCPRRESLVGLVAGLADGAQSRVVLAHIRQCAACFDELKELRRKTKP
jgi:hypothetical protein